MTIRGEFESRGFARISGVFTSFELEVLLQEAERLRHWPPDSRAAATDQGVRWLWVDNDGRKPLLRGVQNLHRISAPFKGLRKDRRILNILEPFLGKDIKSVVNTLFWKPPGEPETVVAYHQDCEFRRPREHFRNLARSYVQLGVALDPHGPENGGMRVIPGSHRMGELRRKRDTSVLREAPDSTRLVDWGLEHFEERDVRLEPGDVLIWNAYLLHGSPTNTSPKLDRRFFVCAYMRATDCDAGELVFADRAVASGS